MVQYSLEKESRMNKDLFTVITNERVFQVNTDDIYAMLERLPLAPRERVLSFHLVGSGQSFTPIKQASPANVPSKRFVSNKDR